MDNLDLFSFCGLFYVNLTEVYFQRENNKY